MPELRLALNGAKPYRDGNAIFIPDGSPDPAPYVFWCEGEKDADAASACGVSSTSHHGGAGKATLEQARHFAGWAACDRTRRVIIAVDRDDAGAACALRRREHLLSADGGDLKSEQVTLVRAADGAGGVGADLADHLAAGFRLRDLVRLDPAKLRPAAERNAERVAGGWSYAERAERARIWEERGPWLRAGVRS